MSEPAPICIECINRAKRGSRAGRVEHVGGRNPTGSRWKLSESDAIERLEQGVYRFYIDDGARRREVFVAERSGRKSLGTRRDRSRQSELLALPECP